MLHFSRKKFSVCALQEQSSVPAVSLAERAHLFFPPKENFHGKRLKLKQHLGCRTEGWAECEGRNHSKKA